METVDRLLTVQEVAAIMRDTNMPVCRLIRASNLRPGEVVDPAAVSTAIRRLWREAGFRTRQVITGVGNQRVVARQADLPEMGEEDLRSALVFQAGELIPIPVEEAILDFQVLEHF